MNKRLLSSTAIAALLVGSTPAKAQDAFTMPNLSQFYVSLFAGATFVDDHDIPFAAPILGKLEFDFDSGYTLGIAVGTRIMPNLRGEVEYSYSESDVDTITSFPLGLPINVKSDLEVQMVLFNLWYDIDLNSPIKPYIGGGIGYAEAEINIQNANVTFDDDGFAFQLGAGARWSFANNMALDVSYRYKHLDGIKPFGAGTFADDLVSHNIQGAITVQLGN